MKCCVSTDVGTGDELINFWFRSGS